MLKGKPANIRYMTKRRVRAVLNDNGPLFGALYHLVARGGIEPPTRGFFGEQLSRSYVTQGDPEERLATDPRPGRLP